MGLNDKGLLVVFEGIDGTGKTTQVHRLGDYLIGQGYRVVTTREPTDGFYGRKIRQLYQDRRSVSLEEELELFIADRREHIASLIGPALERGEIVLCDRYYLSTAAYQGAAGLDPLAIISRHHFAPKPDLALLFEVDLATALHRITAHRGDLPNDFEQAESLEKVAEIFRQLPLECIKSIDANRCIDDIELQIRFHVHQAIESKPALYRRTSP